MNEYLSIICNLLITIDERSHASSLLLYYFIIFSDSNENSWNNIFPELFFSNWM